MLLVEGEGVSNLYNLSQPEKSETARRNTNLFTATVRRTADAVPYAEHLIHRTEKGHMVRSKSELVIANLLFRMEIDYEYERNGTANLFMLFAPLEGWRHVEMTDQRTAVDYAHILKDLADRKIGGAVRVTYERDGKSMEGTVTTIKMEKDRGEEAAFRGWGLTAMEITERMAFERRLDSRDGVLISSVRSGSRGRSPWILRHRDMRTAGVVARHPVFAVSTPATSTQQPAAGVEGRFEGVFGR